MTIYVHFIFFYHKLERLLTAEQILLNLKAIADLDGTVARTFWVDARVDLIARRDLIFSGCCIFWIIFEQFCWGFKHHFLIAKVIIFPHLNVLAVVKSIFITGRFLVNLSLASNKIWFDLPLRNSSSSLHWLVFFLLWLAQKFLRVSIIILSAYDCLPRHWYGYSLRDDSSDCLIEKLAGFIVHFMRN